MLCQYISRLVISGKFGRKFLSGSIHILQVSRTCTTMKVTPSRSLYNSETERSVSNVDIPVPWGTISGKWWGDRNTRPILCIHGWQDNAGSFDPLVNLLPHHMAFLCIDLPGHGLSSSLPQGVSYYLWWDGLIWIRRIVQYFGWDKVSIIGHSLGGYMGYMYAGTYPDEVDLLITLDPVVAFMFDNRAKQLIEEIPMTIDSFLRIENENKETSGTFEEMIAILSKAHKDKLPREACELLLKRGMYRYADNLYKFSRDARTKPSFLGPPSSDVLEEITKKIKCRFLNVVCTPGFKDFNSYKHVFDSIQEKSSYFKLYPIEAGHHVHLTDPDKIVPAILECLSAS